LILSDREMTLARVGMSAIPLARVVTGVSRECTRKESALSTIKQVWIGRFQVTQHRPNGAPMRLRDFGSNEYPSFLEALACTTAWVENCVRQVWENADTVDLIAENDGAVSFSVSITRKDVPHGER